MSIEMKLRPPVRPGLVYQLSKSFQSRMVSEWQFSLVGKFNDEWIPHAQTTQDHLTQAWQLSGKMDMLLCPHNTALMIFKLDNVSDFHRVLAGGPYSVEDSLLMLQPLPRAVRLEHVRFNKLALWITLTGLPVELHHDEVAVSVGQFAGRVVDRAVIVGQVRWAARVKVEVEAEEPLLPGSYVDVGNGSSIWVGFKYEGLPRLCSNCMRIGHLDTDCRKTALQAKMELTKRLEAVAKKLNAPMVATEPTMEESLLLNSSGNRSLLNRKTVSCPTDTPTCRVFKRCKTTTAAKQESESMALTVVTPSEDPMDCMMFGDNGSGSVGSIIVDLDGIGPVKEGSKGGPNRKPKK